MWVGYVLFCGLILTWFVNTFLPGFRLRIGTIVFHFVMLIIAKTPHNTSRQDSFSLAHIHILIEDKLTLGRVTGCGMGLNTQCSSVGGFRPTVPVWIAASWKYPLCVGWRAEFSTTGTKDKYNRTRLLHLSLIEIFDHAHTRTLTYQYILHWLCNWKYCTTGCEYS